MSNFTIKNALINLLIMPSLINFMLTLLEANELCMAAEGRNAPALVPAANNVIDSFKI